MENKDDVLLDGSLNGSSSLTFPYLVGSVLCSSAELTQLIIFGKKKEGAKPFLPRELVSAIHCCTTNYTQDE